MLELWGAEYQESNALLLHPADRPFLERVCQREKCPVDFVGNITGDGKACFFQVDKCVSAVLVDLLSNQGEGWSNCIRHVSGRNYFGFI